MFSLESFDQASFHYQLYEFFLHDLIGELFKICDMFIIEQEFQDIMKYTIK